MKGFATSIDLQSVSFEAKLMLPGCRENSVQRAGRRHSAWLVLRQAFADEGSLQGASASGVNRCMLCSFVLLAYRRCWVCYAPLFKECHGARITLTSCP